MPSGRFSCQGVWPLLSTDLSHVHAPLSVVIDCGPLSDPINGTVEFTISTILGSQAFYRCMEGFLLNGNGVRMCQENGTWTGSDPTCERELQHVVTLPTNFLNALIYTQPYFLAVIQTQIKTICNQNPEPCYWMPLHTVYCNGDFEVIIIDTVRF